MDEDSAQRSAAPRNAAFQRHGAARILLVLAALAFALPATAREWFVSPAGDDRGDGSRARPFRTIGHVLSPASDLVRAGDTITLLAPAGNRTYRECDVRLRVRLELRSLPGERAHIHCDMAKGPDTVVVQVDPTASGSRLRNLELSGGAHYGVMMQTNWYQGGPDSEHGASDVVIEDLLVRDTGRDGIKITPKSDNVTIRRVEIRNTGARYPAGTPTDEMNADGIDNVNGSGMVVEDSWIHDVATTGLYFKGGAADVLVQRNRIENAGDAGILVGFDTSPEFFDLQVNPGYYEAIRGTVINNVVRNTGYSGIGMYASRDSVVANNTLIDTARRGHAPLYFGVTFQDWDEDAGRPANRNPTLRNNLVIQDGGRCIDIRYSNELGGLSGLSGSPNSDYNGFQAGCTFRDGRPGSNLSNGNLAQWRSATGSDMHSITGTFSVDATGHLPAGSPAIDRGVVLAEVPDDIDGQVRGTRYDIGADEVGSGPAPDPQPPSDGDDRTRMKEITRVPDGGGARPPRMRDDLTPPAPRDPQDRPRNRIRDLGARLMDAVAR